NATMGSGSSSYSTSGSTTTGSTTSGTTGTSSGTMSSGSGSTYTLVGKSDELSKHAGHKIEVTGRLDSSSSSSTTGGTTSGTTGTSSSSSMAAGQKLHVESIRMISADCSSTK